MILISQLAKKLINDINVFSLKCGVDFSVKPFSFKNYSNKEINDCIAKNKALIVKTLNKFKKI